ncbi:MAG: hypothetical protein LBC98_06865, partial [Prevotellaceae bacterium]|nr:hypothetical protein [Prevotellaceae bacterium]
NNNFNFMYQDFSKTAASANSSNAMEREPISKNRVSPKNDKSRGNSVPDAQRSPKGMGEVR